MSSWRERMAARAAAAAPVQTRGVRFIGNATGNTNVAKSPTRKASPHHQNRNVTKRALKATARVSLSHSPPQRPGRGAPKFRAAAERHARETGASKKRRNKSRKTLKAYRKHKARKHTRRHKKH